MKIPNKRTFRQSLVCRVGNTYSPQMFQAQLRILDRFLKGKLRGCLKSLICNPEDCRGAAFGQRFWVYFRVHLPNATPLQGTFATSQTSSRLLTRQKNAVNSTKQAKRNRQKEVDAVFKLIYAAQPKKILDIGCGRGRYLIPLTQANYDVTGVEINIQQIESLPEKYRHKVITPDKAAQMQETFDLIIMSHVVEHVEVKDFIDFMDSYLRLLKVEGQLIVATPLLHEGFYDDYDHVKPYTPKAIATLYSKNTQFQRKPKYRLELIYVWFRIWPLKFFSYPGEPEWKMQLKQLANCFFEILYYLSGKIISRRTGWVGTFQKTE